MMSSNSNGKGEATMEKKKALGVKDDATQKVEKVESKDSMVLEEIEIEELAIDGICGVY